MRDVLGVRYFGSSGAKIAAEVLDHHCYIVYI